MSETKTSKQNIPVVKCECGARLCVLVVTTLKHKRRKSNTSYAGAEHVVLFEDKRELHLCVQISGALNAVHSAVFACCCRPAPQKVLLVREDSHCEGLRARRSWSRDGPQAHIYIIYIYIYIYVMYMYICIYVYIYIYREREI